jgi:hypothetical protein
MPLFIRVLAVLFDKILTEFNDFAYQGAVFLNEFRRIKTLLAFQLRERKRAARLFFYGSSKICFFIQIPFF